MVEKFRANPLNKGNQFLLWFSLAFTSLIILLLWTKGNIDPIFISWIITGFLANSMVVALCICLSIHYSSIEIMEDRIIKAGFFGRQSLDYKDIHHVAVYAKLVDIDEGTHTKLHTAPLLSMEELKQCHMPGKNYIHDQYWIYLSSAKDFKVPFQYNFYYAKYMRFHFSEEIMSKLLKRLEPYGTFQVTQPQDIINPR